MYAIRSYYAEDVMEVLKHYESKFAKEGIGYLITRNYGTRANEAVIV